MPWCEPCDRYLSPSHVRDDGTCPKCGSTVEASVFGSHRAHRADEDADGEKLPPIPWHLKALGAALVVYLGYRAYQGIAWLIHL